MRTVIAFDITSNRARYRVVKALKAHAVRVQKSVFEAEDLAPAEFLRLRSKIERHIDTSTDSVRYYQICANCVERVEHYGAGPGLLDPEPSVKIV